MPFWLQIKTSDVSVKETKAIEKRVNSTGRCGCEFVFSHLWKKQLAKQKIKVNNNTNLHDF
jgi:hypothetical protein